MAINPNQNLNTPHTQAGFNELLASLGSGALAAFNNWVANMSLDWRTPNTEWFRANFPLVSQAVLERIAEGSAFVGGVSAASAQAILGGNLSVAPVPTVFENVTAALDPVPVIDQVTEVVKTISGDVAAVADDTVPEVKKNDTVLLVSAAILAGVLIYKFTR